MNITVEEVNCRVREDEPAKEEKIDDDINVDLLISLVKNITIYFRSKEECPKNRGNWIIDLHLKKGGIHCIKYPPTMTRERFFDFIKPLTDKMETL